MRVCRRRVRAAFRRNLFLHFHMHYFINKWWPYSPCANLSPTHHEMGSNRILSLSSVGWHCCLHSCTVHSVEQQSATSCEAPSFKARRVQVGVFVYAINVMSPAPTTLFEQAARVHWMDDGHWHNAMCVCERWNSSRNGTLKQQHEKKKHPTEHWASLWPNNRAFTATKIDNVITFSAIHTHIDTTTSGYCWAIISLHRRELYQSATSSVTPAINTTHSTHTWTPHTAAHNAYSIHIPPSPLPECI